MAIFHGNAIPSGAEGYDIPYSCRFDDGSSPNMTRTPGGASNQKTFTLSVWLKLASGTQETSYYATIFTARTGSSSTNSLMQMLDDGGGSGVKLHFSGGSGGASCKATRLLRDLSAWYHVVYKIDSTESTDTDRVKIYVNGEETTLDSPTYPTLNVDFNYNSTAAHHIGSQNSTDYFDGYMAEMHFIDGTALTPSSFGEAGDYGEWKAKEVSGLTYGTNGFYLDFKNAGVAYASGDRSSDITVTSNMSAPSTGLGAGPISTTFVDGVTGGTNFHFQNGAAQAGYYIRFGWGSAQTITSVRWNAADSSTQGTWKWQGSNTAGGASGYVDIGSSFSLALSSGWTTLSSMNANTTGYLYYQIIAVSGNGSSTGDHQEIEFGYGSPSTYSLGTDASGEDDHFTPTNISASDQMLDTPTNNFSVISSFDGLIDANDVFSEGNLGFINTVNGNMSMRRSTFVMESGKWYWEVLSKDASTEAGVLIGIMPAPEGNHTTTDIGSAVTNPDWGLNHGIGVKIAGNQFPGSGNTCNYAGVTLADEDIIMFAYDVATGYLWIGYNGTWAGSGNPGAGTNQYGEVGATNRANFSYAPAFNSWNSVKWWANFGQDATFAGNDTGSSGPYDDGDYGAFYYQPPTNFKALCSKNLNGGEDYTVIPSEHYGTMLYDDGAGAKTFASHGIPAGARFQPDLVWVKARGSAYEHELTDAVRGVTKALSSDIDAIESTDSTGLTAFGSDGFTVGADTNYSDTTGDGMVAWCWKANGAGSANEAGSINTTATSANIAAGFSISTYAGNGVAGATIGHGLSAAPNLVIVKRRDVGGANWPVGTYQPNMFTGMDFTDFMMLDTINAYSDSIDQWNDVKPTASLISLGTQGNNNASGSTYVAYCWHNVEGYSRIGSYVGNGNVDGPFIYTGFSPAYIITKHVTTAPTHWSIYDSARSLFNPATYPLSSNEPDAEGGSASTYYIDMLSNGFKLRNTNVLTNTNGNWYWYWAFAETPFKYANAR